MSPGSASGATNAGPQNGSATPSGPHPVPDSAAATNWAGCAWSRQNEIVAADAPHLLAWRTVPTRLYNDQTEWRISIERDGDVTTIVQTFEVLKLGPVMERLFHLLIPAHRDRMDALRDDMRRLASVAEAVELEPVT